MDSPVTVDLDYSRLNGRIEELHDALARQGGDVSTIYEDEARLFLRQVIRLTPPKTKQQGEAAIDRDLMKIFEPLNSDFVDDLIIEHGAHDIDTWLTVASGEKKRIKFTYADNTGGPMANFHHRNQDNRGRTYNLKRQKDPNVWYAPYVVSYDNFKKYADRVKSHVGRKKAAWGKSFIELGGKLPSWISRHLSGAKGEFHNSRNPEKPSITMTSRAPGVSQDAHFIRGALRVRYESIGRRIKLVLSGYSKDVASGLRIKRRAQKLPEGFTEAA